jgi:toxin ParE1/3/4
LKLEWTPRASKDRVAAIDFIARDNLRTALAQLDQIERQIEMLIQHPEMGRLGRKKDTRELVISRTPFIVIYRVKGERIELIRLLHGSRQWP